MPRTATNQASPPGPLKIDTEPAPAPALHSPPSQYTCLLLYPPAAGSGASPRTSLLRLAITLPCHLILAPLCFYHTLLNLACRFHAVHLHPRARSDLGRRLHQD